MKISYFILFFVVGIIACSGVLLLQKTPSQNVEEDSQEDALLTYTNDEYGFSFEYPSSHTIEVEHRGSVLVKSIEPRTGPYVQISTPTGFTFHFNEKAKSLADYEENYESPVGEVVIESNRRVMVNGEEALYQQVRTGDDVSGLGEMKSCRYVFWGGDEIFIIFSAACIQDNFLDKIVKTFIFLNKKDDRKQSSL